MYELLSHGPLIVVGVCLRAQKVKSQQQHSRACPRVRFIFNARDICRLSCGRPEVVHCRTYRIAVHVIVKSKIVLKQHA